MHLNDTNEPQCWCGRLLDAEGDCGACDGGGLLFMDGMTLEEHDAFDGMAAVQLEGLNGELHVMVQTRGGRPVRLTPNAAKSFATSLLMMAAAAESEGWL